MDQNQQSPSASPAVPLASTALWMASVRAMENARQDGLYKDPWAAALAGPEGESWIAQQTPEKVVPMVLRTRYFDDFLKRVTREHTVRQIVLLAAGLDTRAYRLDWPPQTKIFELDQPAVLEYKDQILASAAAQPTCLRQVIKADLTTPWKDALLRAGYEPQVTSAWLLEGFLFYLAMEQIGQLLDEISALASPGSWLVFDIMNSITLTHPLTRPWVEMQASYGAPWLGVMDDPVSFLAGRGWKASLTQAGQPEANHGRWPFPVIPTTMPNLPHNWFVTAEKLP